jgi:hypothetical protein
MWRSFLSCLLLLASGALFAAPIQKATAGPPGDEQIVRAWFDRLNALDGTPAAEQAFVELYEPDALHTTGPASHQLGTVTYRGHDGIRKMVAGFLAAFDKPAYRIEAVTANETTNQLFNVAKGPWGGASVAVEYSGVHTSRKDGVRWVYPGAAFFQLRGGKIHRLRLYMATGELAEVEKSRP